MTEKNNRNDEQHTLDELLTTIGSAYYNGIAVQPDYYEAFRFYRKAAAMGNAIALCNLGKCYELGHGVKKDLDKAVDCYDEAIEHGVAEAMIRLGDLYWKGIKDHVPFDRQNASELYISALEICRENEDLWMGPEAELRIADCLYLGIGTDADLEMALEYYRAGARGFLDRVKLGDEQALKKLERSEKGVEKCRKALGLKKERTRPDFCS